MSDNVQQPPLAPVLPKDPSEIDACLDEEQVLRYLDRRLPAHEEAQVEAHVDHCSFCRGLVKHAALSDSASSSIPAATGDVSLHAGQMVDHFMIKRFIGRGGMGEIYLAVDTKLKRRVALKLIAANLVESDEAKQHFVIEARATARMNHPHIVAIHSIGEYNTRPYLALEYLEGESLRTYMRSKQLELGDTVEVARAIAEALHEAHSRQVLHRDLKPENVMLADDGRLRVLDFGLAKLRPWPVGLISTGNVFSSLVETENSEEIGLCGTPAYMAPEQWRGESPTEASDIWSFGVLCYELVSGHRPYEESSPVNYGMRVCEPTAAPRLDLEGEVGRCFADLIARCLDKDPSRRPEAVEARDVLQGLQGERPARVVEQLEAAAARWEQSGHHTETLWDSELIDKAQQVLEQHPMSLPASATRFLTKSMSKARRDEQLRKLRLRALAALAVVCAILASVFAVTSVQKERRAREQQIEAERERATSMVEGARGALQRHSYLEARAKLRSGLEIQDSALGRLLFWQLKRGPVAWSRPLGTGVFDVEFAPDGNRIAAAAQDRTVYLLDVDTLRMQSLRGHSDQVFELAFSPDGGQLASSSWSGELRLWDLQASTVRVLRDKGEYLVTLAFSPDGKTLAGAAADGPIELWDLERSGPAGILRPGSAGSSALLFTPDGNLLSAKPGGIRVFEPASGKPLRTLAGTRPDRHYLSLTLSPDGRLLASGAEDGAIELWDLASGAHRRTLSGHQAAVHRVRFDHTGQRLISASHDHTLRIWDLEKGSDLVLAETSGWNLGIATSPHKPLLVSAGNDRSVTLWRLDAALGEVSEQGHTDGVVSVRFSHDGATLFSSGYDSTVRVWDVATGKLRKSLRGHRGTVHCVVQSPSGDLLASAGRDKSIWLWNTALWRAERVLTGHDRGVSALAFGPDGKRLASASYDESVRIWDVTSGNPLATLQGHEGAVFSVAYSADGKQIASGGADGRVRVYDAGSHASRAAVEVHTDAIRSVAFAPDGASVASVSDDQTVKLLDLNTLTARTVGQHQGRAYGIAFTPDGKNLVSVGADGHVRLWSVGQTNPPRSLFTLDSEINDVAISGDGQLVATAADDGAVRVWHMGNQRPHWHAPALQASPPRLATQRGFVALTGQGTATAATANWERRLLDAQRASVADDGGFVCLSTFEDTVEYWDTRGDRRLFSVQQPDVTRVLTTLRGCVTLARGAARLYTDQGAFRELRTGVTALAIVDQPPRILLAAGDQIFVFDSAGKPLADHRADPGVTALTAIGDQVVLGFRNGTIEFLDRQPRDSGASGVSFERTPSSPIVALRTGPMSTLIAGYANGYLGIWERGNGTLLHSTWLHGPAIHIALEQNQLSAASELGSTFGPVDVFGQDYCGVMRDLRQQIPVVWQDGQPAVATTPVDGDCG